MTRPEADRSEATERLFSYGTLQLQSVQLDRLSGYRLDQLKIEDAAVVATSGKTHHPVIAPTDRAEDSVEGAVFAITPAELAQADVYEVKEYRRERVTLASGLQAWAYVDARSKAPLS
jgi:gamma-glutamylcyclotransferase (GGCT)/AIG2-like uncharacterized protein YtfP